MRPGARRSQAILVLGPDSSLAGFVVILVLQRWLPKVPAVLVMVVLAIAPSCQPRRPRSPARREHPPGPGDLPSSRGACCRVLRDRGVFPVRKFGRPGEGCPLRLAVAALCQPRAARDIAHAILSA